MSCDGWVKPFVTSPGLWHTGRAVIRLSSSMRLFLWVTFAALLFVRLGGTHLHLCFDGQEPVASVHVADGSVHDDEDHTDREHSDRDVVPFTGPLAKKAENGSEADLPPLALIFILLLLPLLRHVAPLRTTQLVVANSPFYLRPPLRGPPA